MVLDRVCQAAASPLIYLDNLATIGGDNLFETVQKGTRLLFADFGVENECKFVISPHEATSFLWVCSRSAVFESCSRGRWSTNTRLMLLFVMPRTYGMRLR